ncbi:MAG TPA: hydrogenase maturation protease [Candidatus Binatia bacterium]|nr:hydrogenase maturation protease [Candidatus Binatia bacterium]
MRTLIAGFGNVLRGDDGFGVEVIRRLRERPPLPDVEVMEVGTAGIRLAQELLTPCRRLIIVDAMARGGAPGTVYVERVEDVNWTGEVDLHLAVPARALAVAKALGALPAEVFVVGCEPAEVDELTTELTAAVRAAVEEALIHVQRLLANREHDADPLDALQRRDEILQIMFWLHGEGLGPDVSSADILRFVDSTAVVHTTLAQLVEEGFCEARPDVMGAMRYRLTGLGLHEGRRRFLDEFEPYLARHAHGECGTAGCDCHTGGAACPGVG